MLLTLNLKLEVDKLTAERLMSADPKHLWKMLDLLQANRPDVLTFSALKESDDSTTGTEDKQ